MYDNGQWSHRDNYIITIAILNRVVAVAYLARTSDNYRRSSDNENISIWP
jgi:hypothetical protein